MKIVVERSGGFAGIRRRGERDGSALSEEQRAALKKLMDTAAPPEKPAPGADRFIYRIEIQEESGTKQITGPEAAVPRSIAEIATD